MTRSEHYSDVEHYYNNGTWQLFRVKNAVKMKWITPQEYELITGEKYA